MSAYVLVIMTWIGTGYGNGGWQVSQQEYANMASCQNAAEIVSSITKDAKIKWGCIPKNNRTN